MPLLRIVGLCASNEHDRGEKNIGNFAYISLYVYRARMFSASDVGYTYVRVD